MRCYSLSHVRWTVLATTLTFIASLVVSTSGAQAVVVDMSPGAQGHSSVPYNPSDQNYGVALVPGYSSTQPTVPGAMSSQFASSGVPTVSSSAPCSDPALSPDLVLHSNGLCSHSGAVLHNNETFALTWDPLRRYWSTTRNYVEQFLSDVASGSGTLSSPVAVTGQYTDATGRAANASVFGGGCIDFGRVGGSSCKFGVTNGSGPGEDYPATNGCSVTGTNLWAGNPNGPVGTGANDVCLTDAQIRAELQTMVPNTGLLGRTKVGYTPLLVLLTPPGVETCLDSAGTLCSANGGTAAQFCSYHSQVNVGGTQVSYVVQPWTATWSRGVQCDDSDAPQIPIPVPVDQLATDVGARLVSPLSQGQLAAITNPGVNSWFALNGSEINDNGCTPVGNSNGLDLENVGAPGGARPYALQREFNNAGAIETDPNALPCTPNVNLVATFVAPSTLNQGDVVQLDGSTTVSSLMVSNPGYVWSFGDGTSAVGPSVVHTYVTAGTYSLKLTVTDRGGNVNSLTQTISVLGPAGQPAPPQIANPGAPGPGLHVRLQLMPQSLRTVLRSGLDIRVSANARADGIVTLSIAQQAAKRAHISFRGRPKTVGVGHGTFSGTIKNGIVHLHLHLSRGLAAKLSRLGHVTFTIKLALVAVGGQRQTIVAAGRY